MATKTCFVTIGATASFSALVENVLSTTFIAALKSHAYTDLLVQYGADGKGLFEECIQQHTGSDVRVRGFSLDPNGLVRYMLLARGPEEGVVISHAGSGTILEALRTGIPLIVVPNSSLLDNHQIELAAVLAEQEYVVHGKVEDLAKALEGAESLRQRQKRWPPPNSGVHRQTGLKAVVDEEMGYLD